MSYRRFIPEDYVHDYYSKDMYLACYDNCISSINDQDMWPTVECEEMVPPQYKSGSGKPKKLRRREVDEDPKATRFKRQNTHYRCAKCDKPGHHSRDARVTLYTQCDNIFLIPKKQPTVETNVGDSVEPTVVANVEANVGDSVEPTVAANVDGNIVATVVGRERGDSLIGPS